MIKTELTCPLGHTCQKVVGDVIQQCHWYINLAGKNPQTGEPVDEYKCAIAWQPILAIEGNGLLNGTNASVQSLRNETVKRQDEALQVVRNVQTIESK